MSQFLKKLAQEQQKQSQEFREMEDEGDSEGMDDEEEKEAISDLPPAHLGQNVSATSLNTPAIVHNQMASLSIHNQAAAGDGSSGSTSSSMPMPEGLLPVGNAVSATRIHDNSHNPPYTRLGMPPRVGLGAQGSAALASMRSQYSPLEWNEFYDTREMINDRVPFYIAGTKGIVFVCLHGAGHSAMSFAALAEQMKRVEHTVCSFDFRGHGLHFRDDETNMAESVLIDDTLEVLTYCLQRFPGRTLFVVGHSMGGAIATKTVRKIETEMADTELRKAVFSLLTIDVVEGTAMEALPFMEQIVKNRPVHFPDLESVIKYGVLGGQVKDKRSARVSMPAQVVETTDGPTGLKKYVWRTDLLATKQYWTEWFQGLTETFLSVQTKKMLFLAGSERMDRELTVAHMQGRYQMSVIADCGHVIQEDQPASVCEHILDFVRRQKVPSEYAEKLYITVAGGKKVLVSR